MNTAVLMFLSYRYAEQRILERIWAAGFDDITLAQARVAARIAEDGIRLTDLAEQAQVTKQSAGSMVDTLERAGYLERVPDPADARARLIRLAARGRAVQKEARKAERAIEQEWERHLGKEDLATLRELLARLRELTDPWC